ncbi:hypothetical protein ABU614_16875 [Lysobacter firmicutimachus]|uniref:Uncharacterized protein n=1 Tax=Lysobacter firmicutimachus TaxID=1792846 RepID=A0AAU8MLQ1_9GAMM
MLRRTRAPLFAFALAAFAAPALAAPAALTPEQVAELYLRVALAHDAEAGKRLNDYLKPAFDGKDAFDLAALAAAPKTLDESYATFADSVLSSLPKADPAQAKPAIIAAMKSQANAVANAQCKGVSNQQRPNDVRPGQTIATVTYRCQVPALKGGLEQLMADKGDPSSMSTQALLEGFATYRKALEQPAARRTVEGRIDLYGGDGQPWMTGSFAEAIDVVTDGMLNPPAAAPASAE